MWSQASPSNLSYNSEFLLESSMRTAWFVTVSILFMTLPLVSAPDLPDQKAQLIEIFQELG